MIQLLIKTRMEKMMLAAAEQELTSGPDSRGSDLL